MMPRRHSQNTQLHFVIKLNVENSSKISSRENITPINCIFEKHLQNNKRIEKRKKTLPNNGNYADNTAFDKKY